MDGVLRQTDLRYKYNFKNLNTDVQILNTNGRCPQTDGLAVQI